jgi:hypothetical protein
VIDSSLPPAASAQERSAMIGRFCCLANRSCCLKPDHSQGLGTPVLPPKSADRKDGYIQGFTPHATYIMPLPTMSIVIAPTHRSTKISPFGVCRHSSCKVDHLHQGDVINAAHDPAAGGLITVHAYLGSRNIDRLQDPAAIRIISEALVDARG